MSDEQPAIAQPRRPPPSALPALVGILVSGLAIRLLLTPFGVYRGDAQTFRGWATRLVSVPLARFYDTGAAPGGFSGRGGAFSAIDHLPGDLWLLWSIAHVYRWFSPGMHAQGFGFLFLLKLVPALADGGVALFQFLIARRLAGPRAGLLAAALYAFNPAAIFLSAAWGQWDAVGALALAVAVWLIVRGSPVWALPALTYAALVKPQLALLGPLALLAWFLWRWRGAAGHRRAIGELLAALAASAGVFLAVALPFDVGVWPLPTRWTIYGRAEVALNKFQAVSENAFNLWGVIASRRLQTDDRGAALLGLSYQRWGELLLAAALLGGLALFARRPTPELALWAACATSFASFMLPTRIHERYLLPALALTIALAAVRPRRVWLAAALTSTYLVNLVVVYRLQDAGRDRLGGFGGRFGVALQPDRHVVLAISAANVALFLAVCALGVALALPRGAPVEAPPNVAAGAIP